MLELESFKSFRSDGIQKGSSIMKLKRFLNDVTKGLTSFHSNGTKRVP